jgi:integrase
MAKVNQRLWKIPGQRTKRKAWGFTVEVNGKRRKSYRAEWTKDDAETALAKALLEIEAPKAEASPSITLAEAVTKYLGTRTNRGNPRSVGERRQLEHLKAAFGAETLLSEITAARVSAYKASRLSGVSEHTGRARKAASVNRPLSILRHMMQLAHEEWDALPVVPRIRPEKEGQGRLRWLEPDEEARLLDWCAKSVNKTLLSIVTVALETGLRKGELLGLTWDRVDMSRGVIRLEMTKSGKRREVPMRQAVYNVLAGLHGPHEGRVWPVGNFRTSFQNAVKSAKLDTPLKFHDCRHSFASWYMMRGESVTALQQILGHATLQMTMKYAHLSPGHLRDEMLRTERGATQVPDELTTSRAQDRAHEAVAAT